MRDLKKFGFTDVKTLRAPLKACPSRNHRAVGFKAKSKDGADIDGTLCCSVPSHICSVHRDARSLETAVH